MLGLRGQGPPPLPGEVAVQSDELLGRLGRARLRALRLRIQRGDQEEAIQAGREEEHY